METAIIHRLSTHVQLHNDICISNSTHLQAKKGRKMVVVVVGDTDQLDAFVTTTTTITVLRPFFRDHPGKSVPEENFMVQGKINRGRHTNHPAGRHSIQTKQRPPPSSPHFLQAECPSCCPTNSVKALKATSALYWQ